MSYPIFYKEQLTIGNLNSRIGIVTLWTPRQTFTSRLDPNSYAICGQLYSKRGINFIIRNILANPIIDTLIICGANRSESAESLKNFIDLGIDENYNVKFCEKSPIDCEIDKESLELFRKNVKYIDLTGELRAVEIQKKLDELNSLQNDKSDPTFWAEPKEFPVAEPETASEFPNEHNVFQVRSELVSDAWVQILRHIMKFGEDSNMLSGAKVKVLSNLVVAIEKEDPDKPELTNFMTFNKDDLKLYYKGFFEKTKQSEDYGYGERMFSYPNNPFSPSDSFPKEAINSVLLNQVEIIYKKLKNWKHDAGAIISIWNPWIDNDSFLKYLNNDNVETHCNVSLRNQNVPCMTQLQFSYINHKLNLTAYFRSNDMFDAWPRNTFALRKLQKMLAIKLDMKVGELTTISNLAQVYELNYQNANDIIKKFENKMFCTQDKRGNLIIEIEEKDSEFFIVAKHMSRDGNEILQTYYVNGKETNSAQKLGDSLLSNLVISDLSHSMDIGRELMKAEIAIKSGKVKNYQQDKIILLQSFPKTSKILTT